MSEKKELRLHYPLNLQLFADGEKADEAEETTESGESNQGEQTFTQSELDSQISKAVDTALKNAKTKWDREIADKEAKIRSEAEEYAKLTAAQKEEAKQKKEREAFEKEKADFQLQKLLVEVTGDLQTEQLPIAFAESLVLLGDAEKIKGKVQEIKKLWDEEIQKAVKATVRQETPKDSKETSFHDEKVSMAKMAQENRVIK